MRAPVRVVTVQVAEFRDEPTMTNAALAELPAWFAEALYDIHRDTVGECAVALCDIEGCGEAVAWVFDGGNEWQGIEPGHDWHHTVLVTTDGGATVRALCETCSGDIGPEVIFT